MADISSINLNNTTYNIKDTYARENYLPLSGGDLTGQLSISTDEYNLLYLTATTTKTRAIVWRRQPNSTTSRAALILNESNRFVFRQYNMDEDNYYREDYYLPYTSTDSDQAYNILTSKTPVDNLRTASGHGFSTNIYGQFIHLTTNSNDSWGLNSYNGTDTLRINYETGTIINRNNIHIKEATYDISTSNTIGSSQLDRGFYINDNQSRYLGYFIGRQYKNGDVQVMINARRYNNNTSLNNNVYLKISYDGTRSVELSHPQAWRKAIEIGNASGAFPLTIAQGGTGKTSFNANQILITDNDGAITTQNILDIAQGGSGNTDSVATTLKNSSTETERLAKNGYIYAVKWGKLVTIHFVNCRTKAVLSAHSNSTLVDSSIGNFFNNYKPKYTVYGSFGNNTNDSQLLLCALSSAGAFTVYNMSSMDWSTTRNLNCTLTYVL